MRQKYKLKARIATAVACCMMAIGAQAQVASYNFAESAGTYTPLGGTATTLFTATDNSVSSAITIPFTFTYNGTGYTSLKVSSNGFISLGTASPSSSGYTPLSSTGTSYNTIISPYAQDLSSTAKWDVVGSSPNRAFVVEWTSVFRYATSTSENMSFQVRLNETTNTIQMVYNSLANANTDITAGRSQIGIKASSTDVNNVSFTNATLTGYTYTNNWNSLIISNSTSATVGNTSTVLPASGTTLTWTPGSCAQVNTSTTASAISDVAATVTWTNSATYASGYYVRWRKVDETYNATTWVTPVSVAAGSSSYTITGLAANTYYVYSIEGRCSATSVNNYSTVSTINSTNAKGLFQTAQTACSGAPSAGTITGTNSICAGSSGVTLTLSSPSTSFSGMTYQWASSTTAGGPYTNQGTATTQATGALAATTYYVVTSTCTASGLTATTPEFTVTVNPIPTVTVTPPTGTVCQPGGAGVTLTASGSTATYGWAPSAGLSATTGASVTAAPTTNTTYTVTATSAAGCTKTATSVISTASAPVITGVTATPASVCSGANSQLAVTVSSSPNYALTTITPALLSSATPTSIPAWTNTGADDGSYGPLAIPFPFTFYGNTYNQLYVGTNGYISFNDLSAETGLALRTAQTFPSTATPNNVIALCMADLNQTGGASTTYFTTGAAPNRVFVISFSTVPFYSSTGGVSGQIQLYETSNIVEVHVTSVAHGTSTSNNSLGIENATGTIGSTPAGRGASTVWNVSTPEAYRWTPVAYNYAWSPGTFLNSTTISNPMATGITASTTYTTTVTDPGTSCASTGTVSITAGAALSATAAIAPRDSVCLGDTVRFNATAVGGGGPYTYSWTGPNSFTSTSRSVGFTTVAASAGTYTVSITDNCAATATATVTLTIKSLPPTAVTPTTATYCTGPGATAVPLTASGASTYAWTPSSGLSASTGASVAASPSATTTYTVTGTGSNGCKATATAVISVYATPTGVSGTATPSSICSGGSSQLMGTATSIAGYNLSNITPAIRPTTGATAITTWTNGADDGSSAAISMPFAFNFYGNSYNQLYVGTNGYVSFTNLSALGGAALRTAQNFPDATTPNNVIALCMADLNQVGSSVTSTFTTGTAPNRVFVVDFNAVPFYSSSGDVSGQIQLYETSNVIEVHVTSVNHATSTSPSSLGIENSTGTLGSTPTGRGPGVWNVSTPEAYRWTPAAYSYTWAPGTFLNSTTIINPMATNVTATTTYTVTASNNGCSATGTVTLTAGSVLSSTASVAPGNTVCAGTNVTFTSTPTGGGAPYHYSWSGPNSFSDTTQAPTITAATPAATGTYTITVTDNCGTASTNTVALTVNALPAVAVTPTTGLYCTPGTGVTLTASAATTYAWSPSTGLSAATGASVVATPATTTTYTVTGTDANGCVATASTTITSAPAVTGATATASPSTICAGATTTLNATGDPYSVAILTENFNGTAAGWTTTNASTGGTVANAAWTLRPDGYATGGIWAATMHSNDNSQFYLTNSDAEGSGSTTKTMLQSPSMNTVGLASLSLQFYHYWRFNATPDSGNVEVSTNGTVWTVVDATTATTGAPNGFVQKTVNLNAYVGNPTFYIRFRYQGNWGYGWAIDNVTVTGGASSYTYNWASSPAGFTSTTQSPTATPGATTAYTVTLSNIYGCSATATANVTVNPLPNVVATNDTAICTGSNIVLNATGASTYTWDNGVTNGVAFTPSASTLYHVTGTDANGCVNHDSTLVTLNALPVVMASADTAVCNGGMVTLSGSGASTYTWDNGVTNNVAFTPASTMTYHVTGTDINGCMAMDSTMVTVNALPTVMASADTAVCDGSMVTLSGSGASTYTWDNGVTNGVAFTPASSMIYHVTGTDMNGCMAMDSTMVTLHALPSVTASADMSAVCAGGMVTLTGGGGATTYTWDNSVTNGVAFTPASTATYHVTGTDANGCMNMDSTTVTVNAAPAVTFAPITPSMVCDNGSPVTLTGGAPAGGVYSGTAVSGGMFDPTMAGDGTFLITYTVTDTNTCSGSDTASIMVSNCTGITGKTSATLQDITVYPNPASAMVNIVIDNANFTQLLISIVDIQGKQVYNELDKNVSAAYKKEINVEGFAKGVYYIRLTTGNDTKVQKLVVQ